MTPVSRFLLTAVLGILITQNVFSQQVSVNTKKIDLLIEEWNIIHNAHSHNGFEYVYSKELLFYGKEKVKQSEAIKAKKQLFRKKKEFRQRITSDFNYTIYWKGIVKADFTKEVLENGQWKAYPSYLLLSYDKDKYWIVGESDLESDKKSKYKLDLGEPLSLPISSETAKVEKKPTADSTKFTTSNFLKAASRNLSNLGNLNQEQITMLALVGGGGLLLLLAITMLSRKEKRPTVVRRKTTPVDDYYDDDPIPGPPPVDDSLKVIENQLKQSAFRGYVINLFDPMKFTYRQTKASPSSNNGRYESEPNLEFELEGSDDNVRRFAIQSLYREDLPGIDLELFSREQLQFNSQFSSDVDLYYIIGVGGPPDRPTQLYLIHASQLKGSRIRKEDLKPFRRSSAAKIQFSKELGKLV